MRFSVSENEQGVFSLGFKEKHSHLVVDIKSCDILPASVSDILPELKVVLQKLVKINGKVNYVECFFGERVTVLNVCMQNKLMKSAQELLKRFSDGLNQAGSRLWQIWVKHNKNQAYPIDTNSQLSLDYNLSEYDVNMPYLPGDFTQVNMQMNALMVSRALSLIQAEKEEQIVDLFCGLGNFTIPMAKSGARIIGIEAVDYLIQRASKNAILNQCSNVEFRQVDLFEIDSKTIADCGRFDKMLLDPPRNGALL